MNSPVIATHGLGLDRGARHVLSAVSLQIRQGEVVALLGPNGAGKSTLLRLMLKLLKPDRGHIEICGRPLAKISHRSLARTLAYVPQHHTPPFPYTVAQVAGLGRLATNGFLRVPGRETRDRVTEVLDRLGIAHLAGRDYTAISGGERQIALIARALVQGARTLLMDEPDAGLDYGNQRRLLDLIGELSNQGYTVVFTTHHPDHTLYAASRAVLIAGGRLVTDGTPDSVLTPEIIRTVYDIGVAMVRCRGHLVFVPD